MKKAILIIDHGSRRAEANEMLDCVAQLVQAMAGDAAIVRHAHMELAEPSIDAGFAACVAAGATEVVAFPYMLSPGKHSTADIPRLVSEAAEAHPQVRWSVTPAFGVHEKLAELILLRAGVESRSVGANRCWHPSEVPGTCGDACRCVSGAGTVGTGGAEGGILRSAERGAGRDL
ncbi:MAG: cobalamin biosynthesis protein CbiX [Gemmatimonadaceae bacterium]|nr:cobalamin biosynthesis protein CbiX [Gemmatimonadaceae bacterium]NUQ92112.1 cobalamin biosynthesis protein CbiX [Gemmatimonadaceae bacterium]